jgi:poly(A) polymerase
MLSRYQPFLLTLLDLAPGLYVAGGAVKDCLLGRSLSDVDIVFPPEAAGIASRFAGRTGATRIALREHEPDKMVERAVVRAGEKNLVFDFTALRGAGIESDLACRDFTLTAMAMPLDAFKSGDLSRLVDPFGGREAIRDKEIRALSDGSFRQDPLRILRSFRLAAELGFAIERETLSKAARDRALLGFVSVERIRDEVFRILGANPCHPFIESMDRQGILEIVFPEAMAMRGVEQGGYHALDVWSHSLRALKEAERILDHPDEAFGPFSAGFAAYLASGFVNGRSRSSLIKLAVLFHDGGKPAKASRDGEGQAHFYGHAAEGGIIVRNLSERLRLARAEQEFLAGLVIHHMHLIHLTAQSSRSKRSVLRFFRKSGEDYRALFILFLADTNATIGPRMTKERVIRFREAMNEMLALFEGEFRPRLQMPPLISGRDLMERFGLEEGPLVGELLDRVEEARLEGRLGDREEALEHAAAQIKKEGQ